jgi:hypothetical protein
MRMHPRGALSLLLGQLSFTIVLVLIAAAIRSSAMHDATAGPSFFLSPLPSGALGFSQEFPAAVASKTLAANSRGPSWPIIGSAEVLKRKFYNGRVNGNESQLRAHDPTRQWADSNESAV